MAKRGISLDRILRVRTLQLGLVQAAEMQAHEKVASEDALRSRIAQLVANVAPEEESAEAFSFIAAAHFRDRLNQSAAAADARLRTATDNLTRASDATREARRDQSAIEKLIARQDQAAVVKAMRALEEAPPTRRNRHDPC
ncbi:MAG: hypothetical protein BVN32_06700 [Proteobacteria bacterium ST_bin14]|nr:MAG: hypothetical protein BVN32_06700 [Proteobacteria bacterium ST_bin14]